MTTNDPEDTTRHWRADAFRSTSVEVSNHQCFGAQPQGCSKIMPVNVIIGRNNTGKSALLDAIAIAANTRDVGGKAFNAHARVHVCEYLTREQLEPMHARTNVPLHPSSWEEVCQTLGGLKYQWSAQFGGEVEGEHVVSPFVDERKDYVTHIVSAQRPDPFKDLQVRRIAADRDIAPEEASGRSDLAPSGVNATNIFQQFLNNAALDREVVRTILLRELNAILSPDAAFTEVFCRQNADNKWEIYLTEELKGGIRLSHSGSGLKTILLVLLRLVVLPLREQVPLQQYCFLFEELENNLHPTLQRRLLDYIRRFAITHGCTFFITTHSPVVIDQFAKDKDAQIVHVTHDKRNAQIDNSQTYATLRNVFEDLGTRASDLFQSNCLIWLEGPSDRIYFNRWIKLAFGGALNEGLHYQCVCYGGSLLAHYTAEPEPNETEKFIQMLKINRNAIVLMDSDRTSEVATLKPRVQRLQDELAKVGAVSWVTKGREVENYVPSEIMLKQLDLSANCTFGQFESAEQLVRQERRVPNFRLDKVGTAQRVSDTLELELLMPHLDWSERITEIGAFIAQCNQIASPKLLQ